MEYVSKSFLISGAHYQLDLTGRHQYAKVERDSLGAFFAQRPHISNPGRRGHESSDDLVQRVRRWRAQRLEETGRQRCPASPERGRFQVGRGPERDELRRAESRSG